MVAGRRDGEERGRGVAMAWWSGGLGEHGGAASDGTGEGWASVEWWAATWLGRGEAERVWGLGSIEVG